MNDVTMRSDTVTLGCAPANNPFRVRRIQPGALAYQFVDGVGDSDNEQKLQRLVDQIAGSDATCQLIVGPHGTGKSTLLQTLRPRLIRRFDRLAELHLSSDQDQHGILRQLSALKKASDKLPGRLSGKDGILILDGLEQLGICLRFLLRSWSRMQGWTVLATAHQTIFGWDTIHQTKACSKIIRRLAEQLIEDQPPPLSAWLRSTLDNQDLGQVQDVREFWFAMYDEAAGYAPSSPR